MSVETIGELLERYDDPAEAWRSRAVKKELQHAFFDWLATAAKWSTFGTLTMRELHTPDVSKKYFTMLLRLINIEAFGKHYVEKVGHSYFNYVIGMELQQREVVHFHFLADRPLPYQFIHNWWHMTMGFAWLEQVRDPVAAMHYVTKYVTKGGNENVDIYLKAPIGKIPKELPSWWIR